MAKKDDDATVGQAPPQTTDDDLRAMRAEAVAAGDLDTVRELDKMLYPWVDHEALAAVIMESKH